MCADTPPTNVRVGQLFGPQKTAGQGVSAALLYDMVLGAGREKTLTFFMTGSVKGREAVEEYLAALASGRDFEAEKAAHYDALLSHSRLIVPNVRFEEIWQWVKINTDYLVVDAGEYGRALAAGIPEYPW